MCLPTNQLNRKTKMPGLLINRRAFTLIELLVVIAIIGLLIAMVMPSMAAARKTVKTTICASNLRSIVTGLNAAAGELNGRLPENRIAQSDTQYITWRAWLNRRNITVENLWQCPDPPASSMPAASEMGMESGDRTCAGDPDSNYAYNGHVLWRNELETTDAKRQITAVLRPAQTALLVETRGPFPDMRVIEPLLTAADDYGGYYGFWHNGQGNYAFVDGHVETMTLLESGYPNCHWHNGRDNNEDPVVGQDIDTTKPHGHPEWPFLVHAVYR